MNNDIRNLSKWLNEEQETPIDRQALARVLAMAQQQEPVYFCDYGYEGWGKVDADMAAANIADGMTVEAYYTSPPAQQDGPINEGWHITVANGHSGYGVYAHMDDYPEEGAVLVQAIEQPAQQEPVAWRELCRRLYVELFHCDQQMMATLDEEGDPMWQQGATVRDVLADAKAALETSPQASKPWVGLTDEDYTTFSRNFAVNKYQARAIEAKLKEKNQ